MNIIVSSNPGRNILFLYMIHVLTNDQRTTDVVFQSWYWLLIIQETDNWNWWQREDATSQPKCCIFKCIYFIAIRHKQTSMPIIRKMLNVALDNQPTSTNSSYIPVRQSFLLPPSENVPVVNQTLIYWPEQQRRKCCLHTVLFRAAKLQEDSLLIIREQKLQRSSAQLSVTR